MALIKDRAVCIRAVDYSETSQVVTLFARVAGKVSAIAKGSKRARSASGGPLELLSYGTVVLAVSKREKLATLTEFEPAPDVQGSALLRNELLNLNCCLLAAELLNHLTDQGDPHPALFDSFIQLLHDAADAKDRAEMLALLILFQLVLLKEIGLQPLLDRCANCKGRHVSRPPQHEVYFSSSANGVICRDCEQTFTDKLRLSKEAAECFRNLKLLAEARYQTLNEIEKLLLNHFTWLSGRRPRMAGYVLRS